MVRGYGGGQVGAFPAVVAIAAMEFPRKHSVYEFGQPRPVVQVVETTPLHLGVTQKKIGEIAFERAVVVFRDGTREIGTEFNQIASAQFETCNARFEITRNVVGAHPRQTQNLSRVEQSANFALCPVIPQIRDVFAKRGIGNQVIMEMPPGTVGVA